MSRLRAWCQLAAVTCALVAGSVTAPVTAVAGTGQPNWGVQSPAQSPPVREFEGMAYDSGRSRTVMFSGGNGTFATNPLDDTWEWDGASWTQFATVPAPPSVIGPGMAYDSKRGVTVLLDNSSHTWEWNGAQWTQRVTATSPPARVWASMAYDAIRGVMVLFGGDSLGQTWTYDGNNWTRMTPGASPSPRTGTAMAFDSGRGVVVLFGGRDLVSGQRLSDKWEWDGSNWTQRTPATTPFPRFWHTMAFDAQAGATVMFGGDHIEPFTLGPENDTWLWDGTNWTQDWTFAAPSARAGQAMAYQSANGTVVMFGGSDELNPGTYPTDTWELGSQFATAAGNPAVTFSPSSLAFAATSLGKTVGPASLNVASSGTGPLLISSVTASADFAITSSTCPIAPNPLESGTFCRVLVSFTPSVCATELGSLTFADNGPGASQTVGLQGSVPSSACDNDLAFASVPDVSVNATGQSGAVVTYAVPVATDEDTTPPAVSCSPATGSTFPIGTTSVTCAATDADDTPSSITASFRVVVNDTDLGLSGPGNITAVATSAAGAAVSYPAPVATDEEGTPAVTCDHASGSRFPVGVTTRVTCTATDADDSPSSASISFFVTVIPDTSLAISVSPSAATAHATVTTTASVTDIGAVTRKVSIAYTVTFTDPSGLVTTVAADRATVTVAPGATVSRSFFLPIKNNTAPGSYVVTVTSSDETGSVTQTATFTVS